MLRRLLDSPWTYFVAAGLLAVVGIVSQIERREPSRPPGGLPELAALHDRKDLNVVFILIDALRADRLGVSGYARPTSPNLDALASGGVRFARTRASSSWTKPSMASLLTSTSPSAHRILRWEDTVPDAATLPAEVFRAAGLRTTGLHRNDWLAPHFGFAQGFDSYYTPRVYSETRAMRRNSPSVGSGLRGSDADTTDAAVQFLKSFGRERFFLYLHYMDVHQYASDAAGPTFGTSHSDFYDSAIAWVDANIGAVVSELDRLGLSNRTLIIVTADHGEEFGEHGGEGHGRTLYREMTDVPLLVIPPFRLATPAVVETPVSSLDVFPTVLDLMGLPPLPGAEGHTLRPLIEAAIGGTPPPAGEDRPVFAELDRSWGQRGAPPDRLAAVATDETRLIRALDRPEPVQLFALGTDPNERANVAASDPATRDRLEALLSQQMQRPASPWGAAAPVQMDRLSLDQLRALGYVVH